MTPNLSRPAAPAITKIPVWEISGFGYFRRSNTSLACKSSTRGIRFTVTGSGT